MHVRHNTLSKHTHVGYKRKDDDDELVFDDASTLLGH